MSFSGNSLHNGGTALRERVAADTPERLLRALRDSAPTPPDAPSPGMGTRSESYFGREGRMLALFAFGKALAGQRGKDVYLSLGDIKLFSGEEWGQVSAALFHPGHRYHLALPSPELSLREGMLGLAGEVFFHELPPAAKSWGLLVSVPRMGALFSGIGSEQCVILWDNAVLRCHEGLFADFFPSTRPIAHAYGHCEEPWKALTELTESDDPVVFAKDTLSGFFVPPDLLPGENKAVLAAQTERLHQQRACFTRLACGKGWTDVLPLVLLEAISLNQSCRIAAEALLGEQELVLRGAALRAVLQTMLSCLDAYPAYRILWTDRPFRTWTLYAQNGGALLCDFGKPARFLRLAPRKGCFGLQIWAESLPDSGDRGRAPLQRALDDFI